MPNLLMIFEIYESIIYLLLLKTYQQYEVKLVMYGIACLLPEDLHNWANVKNNIKNSLV